MQLLPSGDMGSKNLPVPASALPPPPPDGLGDREVSVSPKVKDGLEPIIVSLDLLNESVEDIASVVSESDMKGFTVSDLDKLFQKYFSKTAIADSVSLALARPSPPAVESSLMVRQQVKASDVVKSQPPGKFEQIFSKQSSSSSSQSSGKGGGFEKGYNAVVNTAYDLTHNPLALVDKLVPSLLGAIFKKKDESKESEKNKRKKDKDSFYGQGDVEEGAFYGSFGGQVTKTVGSSIEGASYVGSKGIKAGADVGATGIVGAKALLGAALGVNLNAGLEGDLNPGVVGATGAGDGDDRPLGTADDPLYFIDAGSLSLVTSSVDDIQEEAAEVGMKADRALENTLENPEQSSFANFVGGGDGGGKGNKKKTANAGSGEPGIGMVLIAGMILTALIVFKDVVEKIFDKVIIPLGELLIDFLTALKDPLIELISAIIDVVVVVLGIVKDVLIAISPYIVAIAELICNWLVVVIGIVTDVLVAIKPYIIAISEIIAGTVVVVLNIIKGVLEALERPLVTIAGLLGEIAVKLVGAVLDLITIITWPLKLMSGILGALYPHIIRIADFVGGVIADWFEENKDFIKELMTAVGNLVLTITEKLDEFLGDLDLSGLARTLTTVSEGIANFASGVGDVLSRIFSGMFEGINRALTDLSNFFHWFRNSWVGTRLGLDDAHAEAAERTRLRRELEVADRRRDMEYEESQLRQARLRDSSGDRDRGIFTGLMDTLSDDDAHKSEEQVKLLQGIYKDTTLIANIVYESNKSLVPVIQARQANDLIISSDGQVFETAPTDSILAIQNGQVSMSSTNPVASVPSFPSTAQGSSQGSTNSNTTNVYSQSANIDLSSMSPFSEFCPVGV